LIIVNTQQGSAEWHRLRCGVVTASDARRIVQPGTAPRRPRHFALTDAGLVARLRGSVQMIIQSELADVLDGRHACSSLDERHIHGGISPSLLKMVERGYVVEVDAPADAEPVQAPLRPSSQRDGYMHRLLAEWVLGRTVDPFMGSYWTERGHAGEAPAAALFEEITGMHPRPVGFVFRDESRSCGCSPDWGIFEDDELVATAEVKTLAEDSHVGALLSGEIPPEHMPQLQFQSWTAGVPGWFVASCPPEDDGVVRFPPLILRVDPDPRWHGAFDELVPQFVDEMFDKRERLIDLGAVPIL